MASGNNSPSTVANHVVRVLVPLALPSLLDYRLSTPPHLGQWVSVPVGRQQVHGVVAEILTHSPFQNLKLAEALPHVPMLHPVMLSFLRWAARYTLSAPGEPLRVSLLRGQVPPVPKPPRGKPKTPVSTPPVPVTLNAHQASAAAQIIENLGEFYPALLDGVTGSGKTEVYFAVIAHLLAQGGQALVLVPEIALTPQWLQRFTQRFGSAPHVWHSGLAQGARQRTWWHIAEGQPAVVVGARSALFLPWQKLQLVVVDEEHEPSYKQEEAFRYHGRNLAVQLAKTWQTPIILASATPSLETWQHSQTGKYQHLNLPARHGGQMAQLHLIDLTQEKLAKQHYISPSLQQAVHATLARNEQTLLFLNRRGNAPVLLCGSCGNRRDCPRCDATLVVHGHQLICHHCGYTEKYPTECPTCGSENLRAYGPGTRRVATEIQTLFPHARVVVADSDAVTTPKQLSELVSQIEARRADIIIGTQMVTKGHHFPHLTCVGVIDADMGLTHGDLRAAERTYQLLAQVSGRAGRATAPGHVYLQTHSPSHPLFTALLAHQRNQFYALELAAREAWADPPFGRQIAILVEGADLPTVTAAAHQLAASWPSATFPELRLLGPAPAPLAKLRDRHRWRLLIKGPPAVALQGPVQQWLHATPLPTSIRLHVDVDPS